MCPMQVAADIVVIANPASEITQLTRRQVVDIYMGRAPIMSNGQRLQPYDNAEETAIREAFYHQLIGKTLASVNAYWAGLLFAGRASPPRQVADSAAMLKIIEGNPNAIGYVATKDLDAHANVVFRLAVD
ncbi:MAG: hypothetical protein OEX82_09155 [Nitrosomonas sp.]|nr:hypothetical protein [Nitrosomonas sp.]